MGDVVDAIVGDERRRSFERVLAGNTNDLNIAAVACCCLCDRRGFTDAVRSPGGPEPEHRVLAIEGAEVELFAANRADTAGQ